MGEGKLKFNKSKHIQDVFDEPRGNIGYVGYTKDSKSLWDTTHQRSRKKKFSDFRENLTDYNSKPLEIFLFLFWLLRFFFRFSFVFNSMYGLLWKICAILYIANTTLNSKLLTFLYLLSFVRKKRFYFNFLVVRAVVY